MVSHNELLKSHRHQLYCSIADAAVEGALRPAHGGALLVQLRELLREETDASVFDGGEASASMADAGCAAEQLQQLRRELQSSILAGTAKQHQQHGIACAGDAVMAAELAQLSNERDVLRAKLASVRRGAAARHAGLAREAREWQSAAQQATAAAEDGSRRAAEAEARVEQHVAQLAIQAAAALRLGAELRRTRRQLETRSLLDLQLREKLLAPLLRRRCTVKAVTSARAAGVQGVSGAEDSAAPQACATEDAPALSAAALADAAAELQELLTRDTARKSSRSIGVCVNRGIVHRDDVKQGQAGKSHCCTRGTGVVACDRSRTAHTERQERQHGGASASAVAQPSASDAAMKPAAALQGELQLQSVQLRAACAARAADTDAEASALSFRPQLQSALPRCSSAQQQRHASQQTDDTAAQLTAQGVAQDSEREVVGLRARCDDLDRLLLLLRCGCLLCPCAAATSQHADAAAPCRLLGLQQELLAQQRDAARQVVAARQARADDLERNLAAERAAAAATLDAERAAWNKERGALQQQLEALRGGSAMAAGEAVAAVVLQQEQSAATPRSVAAAAAAAMRFSAAIRHSDEERRAAASAAAAAEARAAAAEGELEQLRAALNELSRAVEAANASAAEAEAARAAATSALQQHVAELDHGRTGSH